MPIYTFRCPTCGKSLDIIVSNWRDANEDLGAPTQCPDDGTLLVKTPSAPNFTVNGYSAKNGYSK